MTEKIGRNLITNSKFEKYLSDSTHKNQYAMVADMNDDEITVVANNKSIQKQLAQKAASPIDISLDLGIADAGATGHFLQPGAPAINIKRTKNPISISQPDGGILKLTHECEIDNPLLPKSARKAHIWLADVAR